MSGKLKIIATHSTETTKLKRYTDRKGNITQDHKPHGQKPLWTEAEMYYILGVMCVCVRERAVRIVMRWYFFNLMLHSIVLQIFLLRAWVGVVGLIFKQQRYGWRCTGEWLKFHSVSIMSGGGCMSLVRLTNNMSFIICFFFFRWWCDGVRCKYVCVWVCVA